MVTPQSDRRAIKTIGRVVNALHIFISVHPDDSWKEEGSGIITLILLLGKEVPSALFMMSMWWDSEF